MSYLAEALFQSETRSALLGLLFVRGVTASVSELARRTGLSARAVSNEVRHLVGTGLISMERVAGADVVRANQDHAAARHLRVLLQTPAEPAVDEVLERSVRQSLVAWGAPLSGVKGRKAYGLNETLLRGLMAARRDGTVLRVLPTVLACNLGAVVWSDLKEDARRLGLKAELGMLTELTGGLLGRDELKERVSELRDRRRKTFRFLPEASSRYERELAMQRSPEAAKRWGFWMNLSEQSFRSTLERHRA